MDVEHQAPADVADQFIPVRKSDILSALCEQGGFASEDERRKFRQLCQMLTSIYHYEYFSLLERLRHDYYYFSPDVAARSARDREVIERSYADLLQSLEKVLRSANFIEVPHAAVHDAHERRTLLRVKINAPLDYFREVRFYRRGRHTEQFEVAEWFGLRRRKIEAEVYDDVVLMVAMKSPAEIASRRELRTLERRKIVPSSVLLKYFRNIASSDLRALFPNARVAMTNWDKIFLGVPAIAGGIPILLNLYATISVLFLVIGFYAGVTHAVADKDLKTALAAMTTLVALGGFAVGQWVKYQRQSLKHQIDLIDNIYYRNINNNAGIFDYVIGAAENQECKEAFLAYHFLHTAPSPLTMEELRRRINAWLHESFALDLNFEVGDAVAKLERLGVLKRAGERVSVPPLDEAIAQLHRVWDDFLPVE